MLGTININSPLSDKISIPVEIKASVVSIYFSSGKLNGGFPIIKSIFSLILYFKKLVCFSITLSYSANLIAFKAFLSISIP